MMSRVKELELENARLKKMYAGVQPQADVLKEVLQKK
jgi:putative transposase